ncbi:hypothetical protein [Haloferax profundi]|uniref:Uncharacterized protein n=1 Tax=Haloferax profundi TaxID=1544718 RepID=A0A0W1SLW4_9EURY|nr:hypothetical protein [Haloferax profundi]KTG27121.1 hypothetical protein AUR66_14880 [Haloferax profundi]
MEKDEISEFQEKHNDSGTACDDEVKDPIVESDGGEEVVEREVIVTEYDDAMARCGLWGNERWRTSNDS